MHVLVPYVLVLWLIFLEGNNRRSVIWEGFVIFFIELKDWIRSKISIILRLKSLMIINSLVLTSAFLSILSVPVKSIAPFIVGRFVAGIMCGLFSGVANMYLSEIAPRPMRGSCGTLYQLAYAIGLLCSNIFGLPNYFGTLDYWPFLYGITLVPR